MKSSIVIPAWNTLPLLQATIASVRSNTPEPYEIIVVDGCSNDGTREWLAGQSLAAILLQANFGYTKPINFGIRVAQGDNIILLNSDVEVAEGWTVALEQALVDDPQVGIVGAQIRDMVDRNQILAGGAIAPAKHKLGWADSGDLAKRTFDDDYLTFCCVMLRGTMVSQIGQLDEQFVIHCSDSDYCYRAREAGWKLCYEPKAVIYHEQEGTLGWMRGTPAVENILESDQTRFRAKWKKHLLSLGSLYEYPWPEEELISPNGSASTAEESSLSPSINTSG